MSIQEQSFPHPIPGDQRKVSPQPPFNSPDKTVRRRLTLHEARQKGMDLVAPAPIAEIDGYTLETLEAAYRQKKISAGHRRHLKGELERLQHRLDRRHRRHPTL